MTWRTIALLLSVTLGPAISHAGSGDLAYNNGVDAWRVKNYAEARLQWERSLAAGGPDEALNNLGYLLYHGQGGPVDRVRAVELWRKGAALGVSEAQFHLGEAHEAGGGVSRNAAVAYAWYRCAAKTAGRLSGADATELAIQSDALAALAKISPSLSSAQRVEGDRLAAEYFAKYGTRLTSGKP